MNSPRKVFTTLGASIVTALLTLSLSLGTAGASAIGTVVEYDVPGPDGNPAVMDAGPFDIVNGPDDALWFAIQNDEIGRIQVGDLGSTPQGTVTEYDVVTPDQDQPQAVAVGEDGLVYFTAENGPALGRFDVNAVVPGTSTGMQVITPSAHGGTDGGQDWIVPGPAGSRSMWYSNDSIGFMAHLDIDTLAITEYALPVGTNTEFLTLGPDGNVWFTGYDASQTGIIGTTDTTTGVTTIYSIPNPCPCGANEQIMGEIVTGQDGNLYYADIDAVAPATRISRVDAGTGAVTDTFPLTAAGLGLAVDQWDGSIWYAAPFSDSVGKLDPTTGTVENFPLASTGKFPWFIEFGSNGNLWFSEFSADKIGTVSTEHAAQVLGATETNRACSATVLDTDGDPLANADVTFAIDDNGVVFATGSGSATAQTDANGVATSPTVTNNTSQVAVDVDAGTGGSTVCLMEAQLTNDDGTAADQLPRTGDYAAVEAGLGFALVAGGAGLQFVHARRAARKRGRTA